MRRLALITSTLKDLALEGMRSGARKGLALANTPFTLSSQAMGEGNIPTNCWKRVRTTNIEKVGDILANWLQLTERTIGDLRGALSPCFGVKRADVVALLLRQRAHWQTVNSLAFQRAGVERKYDGNEP